MTTFELKYPEKPKMGTLKAMWMPFLFQQAVNRMYVGNIRYGDGSKKQRYMSRMETEMAAYRKSGNGEHLFNIVNYAFLEWIFPENSSFHVDTNAESATRSKFGGNVT